MKKTISIVFAFLALYFFSKELVSYSISFQDTSGYTMDVTEKESEKSEKEKETDEKEGCEDDKINHYSCTLLFNFDNTCFNIQHEKLRFTPYFEICSPPPELI